MEEFAKELDELIAKHKALDGYDRDEMLMELLTAHDALSDEEDDETDEEDAA